MTARSGEPFDPARAVADVEALLAAPLPATGPTAAEGDPDTGEWRATTGEGFRIVPLWESPDEGDDVDDEDAVEEAAEARLAALVAELETRWGPHHAVAVHVALLLRQEGASVPPLFEALLDEDCYGDLAVWGPLPGRGRHVGFSAAGPPSEPCAAAAGPRRR
ncbi:MULTISPECIES: hypothetical protein [unclassified Streptomyces]|uniref:hypothetical protein n=1 Tax=unclassified Streptomyces TaxID=2593676 RepID=UPI000DAE6063|nr:MULTISPECIES: hypothetical protein [unclassified Streptomyces]PZT76888.1 hypothetical protein DNK56_26925 [Streptomyces sp. AC1-42W]PZT79156.1 hypothetical protein DNK55_05755 [Streptomyces sp. AC1-42T]